MAIKRRSCNHDHQTESEKKMKTASKQRVASTLLLSVLLVSTVFATILIFGSKPPEGEGGEETADIEIEKKTPGAILVNEDFNSKQDGELSTAYPEWDVTGDARIWRSLYVDTNPEKKMMLGIDTQVKIPLGDTGVTDENRLRMLVSFNYKSTIESYLNDYYFDTAYYEDKFERPALSFSFLSGTTTLATFDINAKGYDDSYFTRQTLVDVNPDASKGMKAAAEVDQGSLSDTLYVNFTLTGKEMGIDKDDANDIKTVYYAIYVTRTVPSNADILNEVVIPDKVVDFSMLSSSPDHVRNGYYRAFIDSNGTACGGVWHATVVPGFTDKGLLPEWKTDVEFYNPRVDETNDRWSPVLENVPEETPLDITEWNPFREISEGDWDYFGSMIDNLEESFISNYQSHDITLFYDPVIYHRTGAVIGGKAYHLEWSKYTDKIPDALLIKTRRPVGEGERLIYGTWEPGRALQAKVFIDDLNVRYLNQPELKDAVVLPHGNGDIVLDDTQFLPFEGEDYHVHTRTGRFTLEVTGYDLQKILAIFVEEFTVEYGDQIVSMVKKTEINESTAVYTATIDPGTGDFENGEIIPITIRVVNRFHKLGSTLNLTIRIFRHDVTIPTGINLASGNVTLSPVFSVITNNTVADWEVSVPSFGHQFVASTTASVDTVTRDVVPSQPVIYGSLTSLKYPFPIEVNTSEDFGTFLEGGDAINFTITYLLEVTQPDASSYYVFFSSSFGYTIIAGDLQRSIEIKAPATIDESGMVDFDGFPVEAYLNDPTGELLGVDMKIQLINPSLTPPASMEKNMNYISLGTYRVIVPSSWLNDWEPGSFQLRAYIQGEVEKTRSITIDYLVPGFEIESPVGGFEQEDDLDLIIDPVVGFDMQEEIATVAITITNASDPADVEVTLVPDPKTFLPLSGGRWALPSPLPSLEEGSYDVTVEITDKAGFSSIDTRSFTVSPFSPSFTGTIDIPSGQLPGDAVLYDFMNTSIFIDMDSAVVDLLSVQYKIEKHDGTAWTVDVPFGFSPAGYPSNPLYENSTAGEKSYSNTTIGFDSLLFEGTYRIKILIETTFGNYIYLLIVTQTGLPSFTVVQEEPSISIDPDDPRNGTYVTESEVWFSGRITDANGNLVNSTVFYDITGIASNQPLSINSTGHFNFSVSIGSFTQSINNFTVRARDSTMGIGEYVESYRIFTVDVSAPDITITIENETGETPSYFMVENTLHVNATITDSNGLQYSNYTIANVETGEIVYEMNFTVSGIAGTETFIDTISIDNNTVFDVVQGQRVLFEIRWNTTNIIGRTSRENLAFSIDKREADITPFVEDESLVILDTTPASILVSINPPIGLSISSLQFNVLSNGTVHISRVPPLLSGIVYNASFDFSELPTGESDYTVVFTVTTNNGITNEVSWQVKVNADRPAVMLLVDLEYRIPEGQETYDVECRVTDQDGDLSTVTIQFNKIEGFLPVAGPVESMIKQNGFYTFTFNATEEYGIWEGTITATDYSGLSSTASLTVVRIPPEIDVDFSILAPVQFQNIESDYTLIVNITSGIEVLDKVQYRVPDLTTVWKDMDVVELTTDSMLLEANDTISGLPTGMHVLEVLSIEIDGNTTLKTITIVKIDEVTNLEPPVLEEATVEGLTVLLSWLSVEGANQYQVYRSNTSFTSIVDAMFIATINATTYEDTVKMNGTYYYAVVALDDVGRSPTSNVISIDVTGEEPPSLIDTIIQFILGLVAAIIAFLSSLLAIVTIRNDRRNDAGCSLHPGERGCEP